ncbi:ParB/RepB/Spo0J family partition protein [Delftia sp. GW456-R20]|uniref:ParB/RepB/Spo0J family partition protein n=1 Tax=Delftia sp. GW456-R20 TaxID=1827145 RepID=UPI0009EE5347|nr:ParB/RepB/Spo0J family partition protein [Delftia sp. GW456-R20]
MTNNISSLANALNAGFGEGDQGEYQVVDIDSIHILKQDREEFEDETQTLEDLGKDLKKAWLQPVVLRFREEGGYWLVAGERRIRAARIANITKIPSRIFDMSEEEAIAAQRAENIHRKNLTQREEAQRVKRDLDALNGDTKALLAQYNKPKAWLSKVMAVLDLGPEASKLISENLTADKEVIGVVRQIEKRDPAEAKATVDLIRASGGKKDVRQIAKEGKDKVKPPAKPKKDQPNNSSSAAGSSTSVATPPSKKHQEPGAASLFKSFGAQPPGSVELSDSSEKINTSSKPEALSPQDALDVLSDVERQAMEGRLRAYYREGRLSMPDRFTQSLLEGIRDGAYGTKGEQALNLAAFMQGVVGPGKDFELDACIASVNIN